MQKTCANGWCKEPFEVTDDDLAFYDRVSPVFDGRKYAIPPPTLCPDCRMQRRMAWRNLEFVIAASRIRQLACRCGRRVPAGCPGVE